MRSSNVPWVVRRRSYSYAPESARSAGPPHARSRARVHIPDGHSPLITNHSPERSVVTPPEQPNSAEGCGLPGTLHYANMKPGAAGLLGRRTSGRFMRRRAVVLICALTVASASGATDASTMGG